MAGRIIDSIDDPELAPFLNVRDRDLKRRDGLFLGEGPLTVERMLTLPGVTHSVLVVDRQAERFAAMAGDDVAVLAADEALLSEVLGFPFHRGVLAAGRRAPFDDRRLSEVIADDPAASTLLLIDGVTNVDNIGLLFRNAAAFGCDGVLLSSQCCDPLYRKALRVSLGHVLSLPWCRVEDWGEALGMVGEAGYRLVSAALTEDAVELDELPVPERCGLIVGQEFDGVSTQSLESSTAVKIPMAPGVDSLNVAAASAVCLHRLSKGLRR